MTTLPSKNPSKNLVFTENPLQAPSKNPSKKHLLLKNLLRTLLRSVRLHDPLGVHPRKSLLLLSGKKKQHKHKLFGPDFPRTFMTLTPGRPGVKKFLPTTGAAGKRTFWCGRPRFSVRTSMTRRVVEKLCTKKVCVDFLAPNKVRFHFETLWHLENAFFF